MMPPASSVIAPSRLAGEGRDDDDDSGDGSDPSRLGRVLARAHPERRDGDGAQTDRGTHGRERRDGDDDQGERTETDPQLTRTDRLTGELHEAHERHERDVQHDTDERTRNCDKG